MKTTISLWISSLALIICLGLSIENKAAGEEKTSKAQVSLYCGEDLYPLASEWTTEYSLDNPASTIKLNVAPNLHEAFADYPGLALVQEPGLSGTQHAWKIAVGRDVVVPVINSGNPWLNHIREQGFSREMLSIVLHEPGSGNWGIVTPEGKDIPVRLFMSEEPIVKSSLEEYIGKSVFMPGVELLAADRVVEGVINDPKAIGFCRLSDILDPETQALAADLIILPIDKNSNGKIDYMEQIYDNAGAFSRGVWIGKYPRELSNEIYLVAGEQPVTGASADFIRWALTGGQLSLAKSGFTGLVYSEVQSKLSGLDAINAATQIPGKIYAMPGTIWLVIGSILLLGLVILGAAGIGRRKVAANPEFTRGPGAGFDENTLSVPGGLYYDNTHTWAFMETDGNVKIGIDDFLQHVTGQVTRVLLKKEGENIKKGELLLSIIQDGKQLDIYAPLSGTIREHNKALDHHSEKINTAPYSDGWVYRIAPSNWLKEIPLLKMADKYSRWLKEEVARVKDFMASTLQSRNLEPAQIILQDGGMLKYGLLEEFGPEVWEDFQTNILDTGK